MVSSRETSIRIKLILNFDILKWFLSAFLSELGNRNQAKNIIIIYGRQKEEEEEEKKNESDFRQK